MRSSRLTVNNPFVSNSPYNLNCNAVAFGAILVRTVSEKCACCSHDLTAQNNAAALEALLQFARTLDPEPFSPTLANPNRPSLFAQELVRSCALGTSLDSFGLACALGQNDAILVLLRCASLALCDRLLTRLAVWLSHASGGVDLRTLCLEHESKAASSVGDGEKKASGAAAAVEQVYQGLKLGEMKAEWAREFMFQQEGGGHQITNSTGEPGLLRVGSCTHTCLQLARTRCTSQRSTAAARPSTC